MVLNLVFLVLLLAGSALFSATETAYTSLAKHDVELLAQSRGRRGRTVQRLLRRPDVLLTTILVGNNLANIGAAAVVTLMTQRLLGARLIPVMSGVLTLAVLIFCEVTPKRIAIAHNQGLALGTASLLSRLAIVLRPVVFVVTRISGVITGFFVRGEERRISQDAIVSLISAGESEGIVKGYEGRMMKSVLHLDDIPVATIMTPRNDVFTVSKDKPLRSILAAISDHGFSRIPVHEGSAERIVGVLLVKDVIPVIAAGKVETTVAEIMKEPLFVPETWKVNKLFSLLRNEWLNVAIVIDQHGAFAGVATVEDIAEEIFGEIYDETDRGTHDDIRKLSAQEYRIAADTSIPMVENTIGISLPDSQPSQTLGAYVLDALQDIPQRGESFEVEGLRLTVENARRNRIRSILLQINQKKRDHEI